MAVVGFDMGSYSCYIAVAKGGGVETVDNEYSNRCTPSYVSFNEANRLVGVSAKNQMITNMKNTVTGFKRLIGRNFNDPHIQNEASLMPAKLVPGHNGETCVEVSYLGQQEKFTSVQLAAVMLTKLKQTAEAALGTKVIDCVISVPTYYTDSQRRALLDASQIAGLNCLRLMNDGTATSLVYGLYKQKDLPKVEDKARNVVFVDLGHSDLQVSIAAFNQGKLKVLGTASDPDLGGRDFDIELLKYFAAEFKTKYKLDVLRNMRAVLRMMTEIEKVRKYMSANTEDIPLNIECLMNDRDVQSRINRAQFESLIVPHLQRVRSTMQAALQNSGVKPDHIDFVELIGGCTRTPAIKQIVKEVFGTEPSTTLNADEAVARGCALQCAILCPTFRVKDFSITDCQPYSVSLAWQGQDNPGEVSELEAFKACHPFPFSKLLTFYRKEPFSIRCGYTNPSLVPTQHSHIGVWNIQNVVPTAEGDASKVKVKIRLNGHGLFSVSSACMVERVEVPPEPPKPTETSEAKPAADENPANSTTEAAAAAGEAKAAAGPEPMEVDHTETEAGSAPGGQQNGPTDTANAADSAGELPTAKPADAAPTTDQTHLPDADKEDAIDEETLEADEAVGKETKKSGKKKYKLRSVDLPVEGVVPRLDKSEVTSYFERECQMVQQDRIDKERADAKNSVEEYVYDMRDKLNAQLEPYIKEKDKEAFESVLMQTEDWLYDEGERQKKDAYVKKLQELKKRGDPLVHRYTEANARPGAVSALQESIGRMAMALHLYAEKDDKYAHIEEADMQKVAKCMNEKQQWLDKQLGAQSARKMHEDPVVLASQILSEKQFLESTCTPILNKPKPKVEPPAPPPAEPKKTPTTANEGANSTATEQAPPDGDQAKTKNRSNNAESQAEGLANQTTATARGPSSAAAAGGDSAEQKADMDLD